MVRKKGEKACGKKKIVDVQSIRIGRRSLT